MGISEINKSSDAHLNYTEMRRNCPDLLRLMAKGKRLASHEENEIPVGEDGKPLAKLQLNSKREHLRGGMPRGDRASTSRDISPQVVARMSADEQIMWCADGGLAKALGPDGDSNAFAPVILGMLNNNQIDWRIKRGIFRAMGTILAARYNKDMVQEIMQMARLARHGDRGSGAKKAMGTILAARYNKDMVQEIMQMARLARHGDRGSGAKKGNGHYTGCTL